MNSKLSLIAKLSGSFSLAAGVSQWAKSEDSDSSWQADLGLSLVPRTAHCLLGWGSSGVTKVEPLKPFRTTNEAGEVCKVAILLSNANSIPYNAVKPRLASSGFRESLKAPS